MCRRKTEKEKLDEFRRLQKLHWDGQLPSQQGISKSESADWIIKQHSDRFSIVNLHWASFVSGATVIIAVAIVGLLVLHVTSVPGTTGSAGSAITNLSKPSQLEWFTGGSLPAGPSQYRPKQMPANMMFNPPWQGLGGIGHPTVAGQVARSAFWPYQTMPSQPSSQLLEDRSMASSSSHSLVSRPLAINQRGCPLVECRGVSLLAPLPTRLDQQSPATGIGSPRSGMNLSRSSNSHISRGRPPLSPLLLIPFRHSRGRSGPIVDNPGGDAFPSQSLKEKQNLPKLSSASRGSVLDSGNKCQAQNPHVGFS